MLRPTRRFLLQIGSATVAFLSSYRRNFAQAIQDPELKRIDSWHNTFDRVWLGGSFWANPMEDWRIVNGAAECIAKAGDRNIHAITHQVTHPDKPFQLSITATLAESGPVDSGFGFRVGIRSDINEFRSNCFAKGGIRAGLIGQKLVVGDSQAELVGYDHSKPTTLVLKSRPTGEKAVLILEASQGSKVVGSVSTNLPSSRLSGNFAIVNGFDPSQRGRGSRYRFSDWKAGGDAIETRPEQAFGPILWAMYTLSDSRSAEGFVLKLSALTGPMVNDDSQTIDLEIKKDGQTWEKLASSPLDRDAWVATFRIPRWDTTKKQEYRVTYQEKGRDGSVHSTAWSGTIQASPAGRPLRLAALTCQNDYAFPYEPVALNLQRLQPDMLYFSGDQIYENHGGYGIIREPAEPAILNYLRKFYQFGWAFRDVMKDRPTVCIPDDHDVFQGNIWGEAGKKMEFGKHKNDVSLGGYHEPARMVNVVHRTNASHHPDIYDPKPVEQDISVYFGDMVYGGVSFAILGDRQWKSGPERVATWSGRADHVKDDNFDTKTLDKPGLELLGQRQEDFLRAWAADWRGHTMKVVLSQTVFAAVATHHGNYNGYLRADLDSGAWPQTPRNNAIKIMRESMALHINGDQHLTTLCQYGVENQRDANWSFCTPAIAVGYPRWWRADELKFPHVNRPAHSLPDTGEFIDGFGNKVYVYAVGNPEVGKAPNRYQLAHQKGSGFGLVTIDTAAKTYHIESFRFLVDATKSQPENQFPGWPVTIHQAENKGHNILK